MSVEKEYVTELLSESVQKGLEFDEDFFGTLYRDLMNCDILEIRRPKTHIFDRIYGNFLDSMEYLEINLDNGRLSVKHYLKDGGYERRTYGSGSSYQDIRDFAIKKVFDN